MNFAITVALGFIVGCAIAGQTFYTFILENLNQFGSLKAMGVSNRRIVGMVLIQGLVVGLVGYGLGVGLAQSVRRVCRKNTQLAFFMPWQVLVRLQWRWCFIVVLCEPDEHSRVLVLEPASCFRGEDGNGHRAVGRSSDSRSLRQSRIVNTTWLSSAAA